MAALIRRLPIALFALTLGFTSFTAIAGDDHHHHDYHKGNTVVDKLIATDGAQALVAAVLVVDELGGYQIAETLSNPKGRFTVLAPSNAAFEKLLGLDPGATNGASIEAIVEILKGTVTDVDGVAAILLKHVSTRKASVNKLLKRGEIKVLDESVFKVGIGASGITVNYETTIIKGNVWASNGLIHFIDTVIVDADPT